MDGRTCYLQFLAFTTGPATEIIQHYFEVKLLNSPKKDLQAFLADKKHILFHEYIPTISCCECSNLSLAAEHKRGCLNKKQFYQLYDDTGVSTPRHERKTSNKITKHCLCKFSPKSTITVDTLDITLLSNLIRHCCQSHTLNLTWLQNIKDERNFAAHEGSGQIEQTVFGQHWNTLETATLGLAFEIGSTCHKMFQRNICQLKVCLVQQLEKTIEESIQTQIEFSGLKLFHEIAKSLQTKHDVLNERFDKFETILGVILGKVDKHVYQCEMKESMQPYKVAVARNKSETTDDGISMECEAESPDIDEDKAIVNLSNDDGDNDEDSFEITSVEKRCLLLKLASSRENLQNEDTFWNAIVSLIKRIIKAGEIDTSVDSKIDIKLTFVSPITDEEREIVLSMLDKYKDSPEKVVQHHGHSDESVLIGELKDNESTIKQESKSSRRSKIICGPCKYEDKIIKARKWCADCKEWFCEVCEKFHTSRKTSQDHTFISMMEV